MPPTAPDAVQQPRHPLYALATFELRRYRQQLGNALAVFGANDPLPPSGGNLQARLNAVLAEQEDRARLAVHAKTGHRPGEAGQVTRCIRARPGTASDLSMLLRIQQH